MHAAIIIRPLQPEHQRAAQALILAGLKEHWGWIDPQANPDLVDIGAAYAGGTFLLAWLDEDLVGTGALVAEAPDTGRIVRMSVARQARRLGIGTRLLDALLQAAREQGYTRVVLETTSTWQAAVQFYLRNGFQITGQQAGDTHFLLHL